MSGWKPSCRSSSGVSSDEHVAPQDENSSLAAKMASSIKAMQGISLRDYLAAHAPLQPIWDFEPLMKKRPEPLWPDDDYRGNGYDPINLDEIKAWESERDYQRAIQWPWAWADAMLAAREGNAHA